MKILSILFIPLLALIIDSCTVAKNISRLTPTETNPSTPFKMPNLAEYENRYPGQAGVYLFRNITMEHSGGKESSGDFMVDQLFSKWKYHRVSQYQYLILNPDEGELGNFILSYLPDSMYILVFYPDSTVGRFNSIDFQEVKGDFNKTEYRLALPKISKGTVVEYGEEISVDASYGGYLQFDVPLQYSLPCQSLHFTFAYPNWWKIQVKWIAAGKEAPYESASDSSRHKNLIKYDAINVPAYENEFYSPYFKESGLYLEFQIVELLMKSAYMKDKKDWSDMSADIYKMVSKNSAANSPLVDEAVNNATKGLVTKRDRLDAIMDYLKNIDVKYSGESKSEKILSKKSGSPLGITILAADLLKKAGIRSQLILIHSAEDGYFDDDYVNIDQLSTLALKVNLDKDTLLIFPYIKNLPAGIIPDYLQRQPALVIEKSPLDLFIITPRGDSSQNQYDAACNITIGADGIVKVNENRTLRGLSAFSARTALSSFNSDEKKKAVEALLGYANGEILLDTFNIVNLDRYKEPLIIETNYSLENQMTITPEEAIFRTGGLLSPLSEVKLKMKPKDRMNPVKIPYDEHYNKVITIHFPEEWTIKTKLDTISFNNLFGSVNGKSLIAGDSLVVSQNLIMKRSFEPKEKITDLMELTGRTSDLWIPAIVFDKKQ